MKILNNILTIDYKSGFTRFWFALGFAVISALIFILMIEQKSTDFYVTLLMTSSLGFLIGINISLLGESIKIKPPWKIGLYASGFLILGLYYFYLNRFIPLKEIFILRHFGLLLVLHLSVSFIPFLNNRSTAKFWHYNQGLFARFFTSAFFTLIIFLGLALAILALEYLFGISSRGGKNYSELLVILGAIFHPFFFLAGFPKDFDDEGLDQIKKSFKTLVIYILIPISLLYVSILYAYTVKILIEQNLPKGWVSKLVLGFSTIGTLSYLLNYMLPVKSTNRLSKFFKSYFFPLLLVPLALLFVAIYVRLSEYGVTEPRYIVAMLATWLLINSVYIIFSKTDNIKILPISMAVLILVSLYGPFNMSKVSVQSQFSHLLSSLSANGMMVDNKLIPAKELNRNENNDIQNKLSYLVNKNKLNLLLPYSSNEVDLSSLKNLEEAKNNNSLKELMTQLNLNFNPNRRFNNSQRKFLEIKAKLNEPIAIDSFSRFSFFQKNIHHDNKYEFQQKNKSLLFTLGESPQLQDVDLSKFLNRLYLDGERSLNIDDMSISLDLDIGKVKVCFTKLTFEEKDDVLSLINYSGYLFIE